MLADFIAWKEKYEISSCSSFVKATGDKGADRSTIYYYCSRSGYYTKKSQGKRHTKSKGTTKMNTYCTAAIVVSKIKRVMVTSSFKLMYTKLITTFRTI